MNRPLILVKRRGELETYWATMKKLKMVVEGHLKRFGIEEGDINQQWTVFTNEVQPLIEENITNGKGLH